MSPRMTFALLLLPACAAAAAPSLQSRMRGATLGALVADAATLGTHYEYDAQRIAKFYGNEVGRRYFSPGEKTGGTTHGVGWGARNFHGGNGNGAPKAAGENTDYGDYVMLLLEHFAATATPVRAALDLTELIPRWQRSMTTWRSWICTQTKQTLAQIARGTSLDELGGMSNAMALRSPASLGYVKNVFYSRV